MDEQRESWVSELDPEERKEYMSRLVRIREMRRKVDRQALREQAFEDFAAMGPHRSLNRLLAYYQKLAERFGPEAVPTLTRRTLLLWAREGNWYERVKERDEQVRRETLATLEQARKDVVAQLSDLMGKAVGVVEEVLLDERVSAATRLQAAKLVFDLAGLSGRSKEELPKEEQWDLPPPPSPEAGVVEFEEYLRKLVVEGRR